jgi:predicted dehydrogenase
VGALALPGVRWGILGTGHIAGQFALDLRRLPEAELAAVGSRDARRAESCGPGGGAGRADRGAGG